jgi:hypothetical protein
MNANGPFHYLMYEYTNHCCKSIHAMIYYFSYIIKNLYKKRLELKLLILFRSIFCVMDQFF